MLAEVRPSQILQSFLACRFHNAIQSERYCLFHLLLLFLAVNHELVQGHSDKKETSQAVN